MKNPKSEHSDSDSTPLDDRRVLEIFSGFAIVTGSVATVQYLFFNYGNEAIYFGAPVIAVGIVLFIFSRRTTTDDDGESQGTKD